VTDRTTGSSAVKIEHVAAAMWDRRYRLYKWRDQDVTDPKKRAKMDGFRRTAEAAIEAIEEFNARP